MSTKECPRCQITRSIRRFAKGQAVCMNCSFYQTRFAESKPWTPEERIKRLTPVPDRGTIK